ncbi:magnesium-dependent phosphatase 1-like isoform X1 [Biomphalaria pfeifferi]|uniref:Magnesium-dependent phosphatase 1 n=1 Tax=Biomphalaria pfeifferi TaxID=112525 RepID=A0AAD8AUY3_BIOPF|nr:magnesium-dependent phosphatase 1-like isoform X1 [Biomphalaria pfeifferi]
MILISSLVLKSSFVRSLGNCKTLSSFAMVEPKLIVFDLDYTLWPFWVDTHVDPPFHKTSDGKVYDAHQQRVKYYKEVPDILNHLHKSGFQLAIASRTSAIAEANELTKLFNWDQYFQYRQIFPGSKITHFKKLHSLSGVPYEEMLFYDDEHRNILDVSSLGVLCMLVNDGLNINQLYRGFDDFQERAVAKLKKKRKRRKSKRRPSRRRYTLDDASTSSSSSFSQ